MGWVVSGKMVRLESDRKPARRMVAASLVGSPEATASVRTSKSADQRLRQMARMFSGTRGVTCLWRALRAGVMAAAESLVQRTRVETKRKGPASSGRGVVEVLLTRFQRTVARREARESGGPRRRRARESKKALAASGPLVVAVMEARAAAAVVASG
jgi:hypothetical protein